MSSKFSQVLQDNQIDPRRVLIASRQIERLRPEDRRLKRQKTTGQSSGANGEGPAKPRSGRPVTRQLLTKAQEGSKISGPSKTRLLRAVNRILEQKNKDPVSLRDLF